MKTNEQIIKALETCSDVYYGCKGACSSCAYSQTEKCFGELVHDVIQKLKNKGHWIVLEFCANEGIYCSECHMKIFDRTTKPKKKLSQYCPHCGSRNEQFYNPSTGKYMND